MVQSSRVVAGLLALAIGIAAAPAAQADEKQPTKEAAVQALRDLYAALDAKDYDKALAVLAVPKGTKPEDAKKQLDGLIQNKEISKKGIDILADKGKWGKVDEVFGAERAKSWAERFGVDLKNCYGLGFMGAEAAFFWDGKSFRIFRCNDIGKLE